jgi:putative peptidoglycan lipid II flippase
VALGAVLAWASWRFDWIGLQAQWPLRVALVAGVLGGVALLYFALLAVCGLRPRHLMRGS